MANLWLLITVVVMAFFSVWSGLLSVSGLNSFGRNWLVFAAGLFTVFVLLAIGIKSK